jgi:hypothetical protein
VLWYNAAEAFISEVSADISPSATNVWEEKIIYSGTLPAGAVLMNAYFMVWAGGGSYCEIQDCRIEEIIPGGLIVDGAITASKINVGTLSAITGNMGLLTAGTIAAAVMYSGTINAGQVTAGTLGACLINAGTVTANTILSGTMLADRILGGSIGACSLVAGTLSADQISATSLFWVNNGVTLTSMGKYLNSLSTHYPTASNFTTDSQVHVYSWTGSAWVELVNIGNTQSGSDYYCFDINLYSMSHGIHMVDQNAGAMYGISCSVGGNYGYGGYFSADGTHSYGVYGKGQAYGGIFDCYGVAGTGLGPISLGASSSASAPSHTALKGTLWVTSGGKLYINIDGSTAWALVGSQT